MRIALASDHAGYKLKNAVIAHLTKKPEYEICDVGCFSEEKCNSINYAPDVCAAVVGKEAEVGILICGTGIGMSIIANKHKGIRAALCADCYSALCTRRHNKANVLTLGARVIGEELALMIVDTFLSGEFLEGGYAERIKLLDELEDRNFV